MKKKKLCKSGRALFLAAAMIVSTLAGIQIKPMEVKAAPITIEEGYFQQNREDGSFLSAYNLSGADSTAGKIRFAGGEWYITGQENGALVLLSSDGSKTAAFHVSSNKYSNSDLAPDKLLTMFDSNFTNAEKALLSEVTVKTDENNDSNNKVSATGKLYLPNAQSPGASSYTTIYLGAEDGIEVFIGSGTKLSLNEGDEYFWLRSPLAYYANYVHVAGPGIGASSSAVYFDFVVVPACHLNLSSVIFASAATAASSEQTGVSLTANTFTLRFKDTTSGATVTYSADGVETTGANGKFLCVQTTGNKIYTRQITSDDQTFTLSDIGVASLTGNDRVWVESTTDKITYAKLGTWDASSKVSITLGSNMTKTAASGSLTQSGLLGSMTDVVIEAEEGYYFPADYVSTIGGLTSGALNGITVTRDSVSQITISGTPTTSTVITLPAATVKSTPSAPTVTGGVNSIQGTATAMEYILKSTFDSDSNAAWTGCTDASTTVSAGGYYVRYKETDTKKVGASATVTVMAPTYTIFTDTSSHDFGTVNEGYGTKTAKTVTITNVGNCSVTLNQPTATSYVVGELSKTALAPNETATFTIVPKANLGAGAYDETITVSTTESTSAATDVQFKVNGAFSVSISPSEKTIIDGEGTSLTAIPTGGNGSYTYQWYSGNETTVLSTDKEYTVNPSITTTFKVVVSDTIENKEATATITVNPKASAVEVTAVYEDIPADDPTDDSVTYKIISGANTVYEIGSGALVIRGDGAFSKFKEVKVDNAVIDSANYTVTEGSTIITLRPEYLKNLKEGAHTFEIVWTDGSAITTFTVKAASGEMDKVPKTGDASPITGLLMLMMISGTAVVFLGNKNLRS